MKNRRNLMLAAVASIVIVSVVYSVAKPDKEIDYSLDVKPILNKKCISCHGGVKKQGGFSLLFKDEALGPTKSGKPAIIPGDPDHSEMIRRITCTDPEERMPYKKDPLSDQEITILKKWIKQGAKWGDHWAYLPVKQTPVPNIDDGWVHNNVDRFVLDKLDEMHLKPSAIADRATLLRRVSLDLTGVPASAHVAKTFMQGKNLEKDYNLLVDSLLASKRFGEHWASVWLDIARYADTKGYEADAGRNIWRYRDWVIRAFNKDMPYNQFITEQIAGDLLPNPTDDDYIATAFQRNTPTNDEGGTNNEEFRVSAVLDRVNTTWNGLMSTTFACVQCHSHPYDPFKHDEYYKFMAYFNNTRDEDVRDEYPLYKIYSDTLSTELKGLQSWLKTNFPDRAKPVMTFLKTGEPAINSTTADSFVNSFIINNNGYLVFKRNSSARLKAVDMNNVDELILTYRGAKAGGVLKIHDSKPNGPVIATCKLPASPKADTTLMVDFPLQKGIKDIYLTYDNPAITVKDNGAQFNWFSFTRQFPGKGTAGLCPKQKNILEHFSQQNFRYAGYG